jgi:hypothetical protein
MKELRQVGSSRGEIALRLLFTLVCMAILEILKLVLQAVTLFQFFLLLVTKSYSEPLRGFSNKAATYVYRLTRYITLNENERPFPFSDFPAEIEKPRETVLFD